MQLRDGPFVSGGRPGLRGPSTAGSGAAGHGDAAWTGLAPYYDRLFPPGRSQLAFIREILGRCLRPARRILDAGCATGGYALALAEASFEVVGVDRNPAMVRVARARAGEWAAAVAARGPGSVPQGWGPTPLFAIADLTDLGTASVTRASPGGRAPFDAIVCLGNTLASLLSAAELGTALGGMAAVLAPGGKAALQTVNYDRLAATAEGRLPPLTARGAGPTGGDLVLHRLNLPRADGLVSFVTTLEELGGDRGPDSGHAVSGGTSGRTILRAETLLRPVRREELETIARLAFHGEVEVYGDFVFSPWSEVSPATVVVATRGADQD